MTRLRILLVRLWGLRRRRAIDREFEEEVAAHLAEANEEYVAQGLSPADARLAAIRSLGGVARTREAHRDMRSFGWIEDGLRDVRYAVRSTRRAPLFAIVTTLTIGLGVGTATVLFAVTYGVLAKPLPWPNADRIVVLKETRGGAPPHFGAFTNAEYLAWDGRNATVERLAAWSQRRMTLTGAGESARVNVTLGGANLFVVLGVHPLIGGLFTASDESAPVAVVSEPFWRTRLGGDRSITHQAITLDGRSYSVLGVLPDGSQFPDRSSDVILPFAMPTTDRGRLALFDALALVRPGATPSAVAAEGTARGQFVVETSLTAQAIFGNDGPVAVTAEPLSQAVAADVRAPLLLLMAAAGLLFVAATANVASLQLARSTARRRELAIRMAIGASAGRVVRHLVVETLVLAAGGAAIALASTRVVLRALPFLLPADFPRTQEIALDGPVAAFALLASAAAMVAVGLLPLRLFRRVPLSERLARSAVPSSATGRSLPVTGQISIACVLLVGAALLGRSFFALLDVDRGYDPSHVLSALVPLPGAQYTPARRLELAEDVLRRLRTSPLIASAAFTSETPVTAGGSSAAMTVRAPRSGPRTAHASPRVVSVGYFETLGMHFTAGRAFSTDDTESAQPVCIVNRRFEHDYLDDAAIGVDVPIAYVAPNQSARECRIIGVVETVQYVGRTETSQSELFYSANQLGSRLPVEAITFVVRTTGAAGAGILRSSIRQTDQGLVADAVFPLSRRIVAALGQPLLYAVLFGGFASAALLLATTGVFGLLSYGVAQRSRELAIRSALGATRQNLLRLVVRDGLAVALPGLAVGLVMSAWMSELLAAELFGTSPHDPATFLGVPLTLLGVVMLASLLPAARAARTTPIGALKEE
jgi:putative ABC transport system permease protein